MIRSASLYLCSKYYYDEKINIIIDYDKKNGFVHYEEIIKLFELKDNYPTFEEFYKNEIVPFFMELEKNVIRS